MIKVLFVCHGTTRISLEIPPKTTKKQRFFRILLQIYYILSSDMIFTT